MSRSVSSSRRTIPRPARESPIEQAGRMIVDSARETWDSVKAIASGDFGPADLGNVAIAILSIPSGGEAAAARPALTTLFRAVSPAEFRQVMRTGAFEAGANSLGGKWLAESRGDAVKWGETMSRGGIVQGSSDRDADIAS